MTQEVAQPAPKQSNTPALISLICGVIGCIPLAQIVAIICGIIGLRRAKVAQTGRGMALTGLILGIIFLIAYAGFGVAAYATYRGVSAAIAQFSAPTKAMTSGFLRDLSQGDISSAVESTNLSQQDVKKLSEQAKAWGQFQDVVINDWNVDTSNNVLSFKLGGTAKFTNGSHPFKITLTKQGDKFRITDYSFE